MNEWINWLINRSVDWWSTSWVNWLVNDRIKDFMNEWTWYDIWYEVIRQQARGHNRALMAPGETQTSSSATQPKHIYLMLFAELLQVNQTIAWRLPGFQAPTFSRDGPFDEGLGGQQGGSGEVPSGLNLTCLKWLDHLCWFRYCTRICGGGCPAHAHHRAWYGKHDRCTIWNVFWHVP